MFLLFKMIYCHLILVLIFLVLILTFIESAQSISAGESALKFDGSGVGRRS